MEKQNLENNLSKDMFLGQDISTMIVIGSTGTGKTKFVTSFASKDFKPVLERCIGETNSTIVSRKVIFTDNLIYEHMMRVAVKKKNNILSTNDIYDAVIASILYMTKNYSKYPSDEISLGYFKKILKDKLTKVNTKSMLRHINEDVLDNGINIICDLLSSLVEVRELKRRYMAANNELTKPDGRGKSKKINQVLEAIIEDDIKECRIHSQKSYLEVEENFNKCLNDKFYQFFNDEDVSSDGYHYRDIHTQEKNLDNGKSVWCVRETDKTFVDNFFANNNIEKNNLSIEVLLNEIIIYAPLNKVMIKKINNDGSLTCYQREFLKNENGDYYISLLDTKGLFHSDENVDESIEYVENIVYNNKHDSLVFIKSILGDSNSVKASEVINQVISKLNKEIPTFVLNNKVDLFVANEKTKYYSSLIDEDEEEDEEDENDEQAYDYDVAKKKIDRIILKQKEDCISLQKDKNYKLKLEVYAYMMGVNKDIDKSVRDMYSFSKVATNMLSTIAKDFASTKYKINYSFDSMQEAGARGFIDIYINEDTLESIISKHMSSEVVIRKKKSMIENIDNNYGIRPNGNSYNALARRLAFGDGYSAYSSGYFYNCSSFKLDFPNRFRSMFERNFVKKILMNAVKLNGGKFEADGYNKFIEEVLYSIDLLERRMAVSVFYNLFLESERKNSFDSYKVKYNSFLKKSSDMIESDELKEKIIVEMKKIIKEMIAMNISRIVRIK